VPPLTPEAVTTLLGRFLGEQQQIPPMYSALKREGEPLYRLARRGVTVERAPRSLVIDSLQLLALHDARLELRVLCSKGTYVRVLAEDLARALGTCGRLYSLRREYVEPFAGEPMISLAQLEAARAPLESWPLLPADRALRHLPVLRLTPGAISALVHGQPVHGVAAAAMPGTQSGGESVAAGPAPGATLWRLYDDDERFLGLGETDATHTLRVRRLFSGARPPRPEG